MNISNNYSAQNFQARIKMKPSNVQLLKNAALGTTATVAGVASIAAGIDSARIIVDDAPTVYGKVASPEVIDSAKEFLVSHDPEGLPVQSTAIPLALSSYGVYNVQKGADYLNKEIPD